MITMASDQLACNKTHSFCGGLKKAQPRAPSPCDQLLNRLCLRQPIRDSPREKYWFPVLFIWSQTAFLFLRCSLCKLLALLFIDNPFSNMEDQVKPRIKRKTNGYNSAAKFW